jgi:hypothetical protein
MNIDYTRRPRLAVKAPRSTNRGVVRTGHQQRQDE